MYISFIGVQRLWRYDMAQRCGSIYRLVAEAVVAAAVMVASSPVHESDPIRPQFWPTFGSRFFSYFLNIFFATDKKYTQ